MNYYGPTDFTKSYGKSVDAAEVLPLFLGGDLEHERLAHIKASPLNWVSPSAAPILTIHGTEDKYVAYEQAVWLNERLKAAGVETELETLEGAGHGFKGTDAERAERRLFEFFDKHLLSAGKTERKILIADHGPGGEVIAMTWPSGKVLWRVPNSRGRDVQALPNGHVLMTLDVTRRVVELDQDHRSGLDLWRCGRPRAADRGPASGERQYGDWRCQARPDYRSRSGRQGCLEL